MQLWGFYSPPSGSGYRPVAKLKLKLYFFSWTKPINMKKFFPTRLAIMLYALAMGTFGVLHLMNADMMGGMVPDFMPGGGKIWVYVTGCALIAAALAILINKFTRPACYLLAVLLLLFVLLLHLKPALDGNLGNLLKDSALAMAAIIIGNNSKH